MWPTRNDAIVMYARFCEARYGVSAYAKVKWQAAQLARMGDLGGEKIWNEVAEEIRNKINPAGGLAHNLAEIKQPSAADGVAGTT
jgi:hypothetical protein